MMTPSINLLNFYGNQYDPRVLNLLCICEASNFALLVAVIFCCCYLLWMSYFENSLPSHSATYNLRLLNQ